VTGESILSVENQAFLASAIHDGSEDALKAMVRTFQNPLYGYALRLLNDRFAAEEVVQDTFLRAYQALTVKYDALRCRELRLQPWLFRITRNLAQNRRRDRKSNPEEPCDTIQMEAVPNTQRASNFDPEWLDFILNRQRPGNRELLCLRFVEELSYREIGEILHISEASARGKVFRALKNLQKMIDKKVWRGKR
jgi:RNA polymerase sigma-70 factor, ECF subfamily